MLLLCLQSDADKLEAQARELSGPDGLAPDASGNDLQRALAEVAAANEADKFAYNRFFAVGLFRWVGRQCCGSRMGGRGLQQRGWEVRELWCRWGDGSTARCWTLVC